MNSRQRIEAALNHRQPDRVPLDLGASPVSGMQVSCVYKLRQALGLDKPGTPVKVIEPYQMLGEIAPDLQDALGIDVVGLGGPNTMFGFPLTDWKPWTTFDGTPVLVPGGFNTDPEPNGDILMYPEGDKSVPPSGRMPKGGFYFDSITRQEPDRRRQAERRGQPGGVRPGLRRNAATLRHARPIACGARAIGRSWPTSAARPSATSPWCPARG